VPEPLPLEVPAEHRDGPVTLRGIRVAPGVVVGTARVVRDSEEDQLQPAEILVCETTNPSRSNGDRHRRGDQPRGDRGT
jgi:phosphoenolpyruvate synthase/pyruvate phosphate dikinase